MTNPPPVKRRRLGHRLRDMRLRAGLTLEAAAPRLDLSRTSLNRFETGQYKASVHLIRSMMDLYDCYVDGLLDEAREALKPRWYQRYSSSPNVPKLGCVELEDEAVHRTGGGGAGLQEPDLRLPAPGWASFLHHGK